MSRSSQDVLGNGGKVAILTPLSLITFRVEARSDNVSLNVGDTVASEELRLDEIGAVFLGSAFTENGASDHSVSSLVVPFEIDHGVEGLIVIESMRSLLPDHLEAIRKIARESTNAVRALDQQSVELNRRTTQRLRTLTAQSATVVIVVGADRTIEFCTPNAMKVLGCTDDELVGTDMSMLFPDSEKAAFVDLLDQVIGLAQPLDVELVMQCGADAPARWFRITLNDQTLEEGIEGIVITAQDIDDRHKSEARVLRSEARFRSLVQRSSDIVAICDEDGLVTYISPASKKMLGYEPSELIGTSVLEVMSMTALSDTSELRAQLTVGAVEQQQNFEIRTAAKDGSWRYLNVTATNLLEDPAVEGFVLNVRDDTERLSLERSLRHQANHDALTKLANRSQFTDGLSDVLADGSRSNEVIGVMFIDLDDFKTINDALGHAVGDQVLIEVGDRLRRAVRMNDMVARFGGDEFAVLLTKMYGEHEGLEMAARLLEALAVPIALEGRNVSMNASIGVSFDRQRNIDASELIKQADVAMYASKDKGKGRVSVFNQTMMTSAGGRLDLIDSLREAIDDGQITVHYQPIVNLTNERIVGFEALARWEHPTRGMISPAGFIPVAEETGLIGPLGLNVLKTAAAQLVSWVEGGHDIYVSVNVSARQLQNPSVVKQLSDAVEEAGLEFDRVVLEVTESVFVADKDLVADRLRKLRNKGFRIAIDDFGTGYSSLQYLQQFEFDVLKVDKSFVDRLGTSDDTGLVQTVVDIARRMGAVTVAEGIESAQQATELRNLNCDLGQGYYYARPMSAEKTDAALASEPLPLRDPFEDETLIRPAVAEQPRRS